MMIQKLQLRQRVRRAASRQPGALGHPDIVATPQARRKVVARRIERGQEFGPGGTTQLTYREPLEQRDETRPLEFGLIRRVFSYMRPHSKTRNWLLFSVLLRAIQLPALAALLTHVINGPLVDRDTHGTLIGAFGPTTSKAVEDAGLKLDVKAPQPEAPSMVAALDKYLCEINKKIT